MMEVYIQMNKASIQLLVNIFNRGTATVYSKPAVTSKRIRI